MHRYFFTTKDAFISSGSNDITGEDFKDKNTGQDEILELKKVFFDREFAYPTRVLLQFDASKIESYISSSVLPNTYKLNLRLYETEGTSGLSEDYTIAAYPLSESWDEGTGKELDVPKTIEGCSWKYRQNYDGASEIEWTTPGGTYIAGDEVTQSFSSESPDINMDITSIVDKWFNGTNSNYGLLLRFSGSRETTSSSFEDVKFFSRQTNTIYSPKIELKWDDHIPATGSNTGSLTSLDVSGNSENYLYPIHFREAYKENETVKFRFGARKRYIQKSFSTSVQTVSGSFIPHGSGSYSIIDMATNESVVPFSSYTTMSCDSTSNYFKQDLNAFEPNRAYKILIKVNHDDGQKIIYDNDFEFILRT
tara:strand:- start:159 stop:1253 length:1095 start_codon:yes stop_codon:yes gene_type:complete